MRVVLQRVRHASVKVGGKTTGQIDNGVLILLGVGPDDDAADGAWLAAKVANLRIFSDDDGRMNRSLLDVRGGALVVSQFTLYGDCRKGRRPSFVHAARPEVAQPLYERFCQQLLDEGVTTVERGVFGAMMDVSLLNDGPVTLVIDSP
jgi:D-tyrosyl-tRNA(Tyr) deacylase